MMYQMGVYCRLSKDDGEKDVYKRQVWDKFFVTFSNPVEYTVIFQNISGEDRFSFIGFDAC